MNKGAICEGIRMQGASGSREGAGWISSIEDWDFLLGLRWTNAASQGIGLCISRFLVCIREEFRKLEEVCCG
jgi:hypothetical protein